MGTSLRIVVAAVLLAAAGPLWSQQTQPSRTTASVPLRVAGQVVFGLVGGACGAIFTKVHPVLGGTGWVIGSSFGVFALGDLGTERGSYWWTLAGGAATALAWTPSLAKARGLEAGIMAGLAIATSLTAEIITYHVTEKDPSAIAVSVTPFGIAGERGTTFRVSLTFR